MIIFLCDMKLVFMTIFNNFCFLNELYIIPINRLVKKKI